ncbi:hypothetical protein LUR56_29880 [Streptomyces sp. MT29]|nr:hypothetical protein [Streptomyces sp. MT29]
MRTTGYGMYPEDIAARLAAAGEAWRGVEVLERSEEFDGDGLREMARRYGGEDELVVIYWGNHAVPSVALEAEAVAAHAEMVVGSCYECWLYCTDGHVLIEFQDGEGFVAARIPN